MLTMSPPKVSVCLPIYNGERHMQQLLDSILAQTFRDFEFIISDNCSTDRTEEICRAYAARDPRVVYSRNETNIGANANTDLLVHMARGEYWLLCGHDDIVAPTFLEKCLAELERDRGLVLCHSLTQFIGDEGEQVQFKFYKNFGGHDDDNPYEFRLYAHVAEEDDPAERFKPFGRDVYIGDHHYGLTRRAALLKTHLFEPYYGSDTVVLAELALMGRFKTIDETLFFRRIHQGGTFYLSPEEQQEHVAPGTNKHAPRRLAISKAYARAVMHVEGLTLEQRLRCLSSIAGRTAFSLKHRIWKRLKGLSRHGHPQDLGAHKRQA
ncbi:MAG: glycosyltransferase [Hyphomicrobiaceae bacterium]|nr:MAG: glycosyltransferase [Hyphomicrobiaceae bacterium]